MELAEEILEHAERLALYRGTLAVAVEAFLAAGRIDDARAVVARGRARPSPAGKALLDEAEARVPARRAVAGGRRAAAALRGGRAARARLPARRVARNGRSRRRAREVGRDRRGCRRSCGTSFRRRRPSRRCASPRPRAPSPASLGIDLPAPEPARVSAEPPPDAPSFGERLVTSLFADVRGYTAIAAESSPQELTERMTSLYRFARTEVERHFGIVDKFAGDAVMATFNVSGSRIDHCLQALQAALALRDKAALLDLQLGIGIAVGPAVLGPGASDANVAVRGVATNLAARLQAAAGGGEIVLSEEAFRRVEDWLSERGMAARSEQVELKGFEGAQAAYRIGRAGSGDPVGGIRCGSLGALRRHRRRCRAGRLGNRRPSRPRGSARARRRQGPLPARQAVRRRVDDAGRPRAAGLGRRGGRARRRPDRLSPRVRDALRTFRPGAADRDDAAHPPRPASARAGRRRRRRRP